MSRSWQSYLVNALLRLAVKKRLPLNGGVERLNARVANVDSWLSKPPDGLGIERIRMGDVPGERLKTGESCDDRVLFYIHGGGFALGILGAHRDMVATWCRAMKCTAYLPDYRLAPQHPFPAAPDDCIAAYRSLIEQGADADRIVVAGDSAGGCLSLALLQGIRNVGLPMPAAGVLLSPAADLTMSGESVVTNERKDPLFHTQALLMLRNAYAPERAMLDPAASPLFGKFNGLPPLKILVGSTEVLLSDAERVADRARAAGIDAQLDVWQGLPHVFPVITMLPESRRALAGIQGWLEDRNIWSRN